MGTYGKPRRWARLYRHIVEHRELVDQLRALQRAAHHGEHPEDVAAVRAAVWAAHERPTS